MSILIFVIVAGLMIWIMVAGLKVKATKETLKVAFLGSHAGWDSYVTPDLKQVIAIDRKGRRIAVGPLTRPIEVNWADIAGCEIERNGQSLTATVRGTQAMGRAVDDALLGSAGLLLGNLSGSKRNGEKVSELNLKVLIDYPAAPLHHIIFAKFPGNGVKPESALLKPSIERIEHFHALLSEAIRSEDRARLVPSQQPPLAQTDQL